MEDLVNLINKCKRVYYTECGYLPDTIIFDKDDFDKIRSFFYEYCIARSPVGNLDVDHILQLRICTDELLSIKGYIVILKAEGHLRHNHLDTNKGVIGYFISDPVLSVKLNSKYIAQHHRGKDGEHFE